MPDHNTLQRDAESGRCTVGLSVRWLVVFIAAMLLFGLTAARTIQWQDYGHYTLRIVEGELFNELGLALAHPLHFWLGSFMVGVLPTTPAHAMALASALAGAVTVANVFGCVVSLTRRLDAGLVAALGLALANTFWRMSTMPECYTVTTALLSAELWCLALYCRASSAGQARWYWLAGAFFFNGLGLANHNLALLTGPILGVMLIKGLAGRRLGIFQTVLTSAVWFIGAMPYLVLVAIEAQNSGSVGGAVHSALFGTQYADSVMNASPSLKLAGISVAFTLLSFFNLTLIFAGYGLWRSVAEHTTRALGIAFACALLIHLLFVLRYNVIDQHTFLLPAYTVIVLFAGLGYARFIEQLSERSARRLLVTAVALSLAAPAVYVGAAAAARSGQVLGGYARNKPYRDDYRYLFVPWGAGETSADRMANEALEIAGDDGVVLMGDRMASFAVYYLVHERGLDGVTVYHVKDVDAVPWSQWPGRRVAWVPANTKEPEPPPYPDDYVLYKDPPIYPLIPDSAPTRW